MGTAKALERGAEGERRVAEILEELRQQLGYRLLNDVLIEFNGHTSQMDHVLIDRFGLLVVETKCYGALLKGTSDDHNWTVCYGNGHTRQMYNPLKQNDGHRKWLHKVLVQNQRDMPENYVQSLIVFAKGEIGGLTLSDIDQMRVVTQSGLAEYVQTRYDFQPNPGQLGPEAQDDLWGFLIAADKSTDPLVVARHVAEAQAAKSGKRPPRPRTLGPKRKSQAEFKWEAKQARKERRAREEFVRAVIFVAVMLFITLGYMLAHWGR